jgi:hypoxanthine phosphoribosyltransferase
MAAKPFELLLDQRAIKERVADLGRRINRDYAGKSLVLVGVLKGCVVFLADLIRHLELPVELEFVSAASYRKGKTREDNLILGGGVEIPLKDRHVLIVEGIVDSGRTVTAVRNVLERKEPASVEIVTLLDKPGSHRSRVNVKYRGFAIGNEFVIGYGLDNAQRYRNLPFVGRLREE